MVKDAKFKARFFQALEVCANNSRLNIKWHQREALLHRPGGFTISVGEGAKTGVLSHKTKWSKKGRGGEDLKLARLPNE
jgi:hypothetical protein